MATARDKSVLITELNSAKTSPAMVSLVKLLDIMVQEIREENDTALHEDVLRNQGGIEALNALRDSVSKGLPSGSR